MFIHLHAPTYTFIHLHAHSYTFILLHELSYIFIHLHMPSCTFIQLHAPLYTFMHTHTPSYSFMNFHTSSYTFICLHAPSCAFMHLHVPSYTCSLHYQQGGKRPWCKRPATSCDTSGSIRSNKAHKSHTKMAFIFLLHLFLCFSFSLFLLVIRHPEFCKTKKKRLKCKQN